MARRLRWCRAIGGGASASDPVISPTDLELCRYASSAYTTKPTWQRGDCKGVLFPHPGTDIDIVAFPGTEDLLNWRRDLNAWPVWHSELGFVHRGFYQGALGLAGQIDEATRGRRIGFCGHSLGGALAFDTAAIFLTHFHRPVDICVTFGAPRPGGYKLRRVLRHGVHRLRAYRHWKDPIPKVPWLPLIYVQPTHWIELTGDASWWWVANHEMHRYDVAMQEVFG